MNNKRKMKKKNKKEKCSFADAAMYLKMPLGSSHAALGMLF
jgi:hypothetical protein